MPDQEGLLSPATGIWRMLDPAASSFLRRTRLPQKAPHLMLNLQLKLSALYGADMTPAHAERYLRKMTSAFLLGFTGAVLLGAASGSWGESLGGGLFAALLAPVLLYRQLDREIKRKKEA
ncbi:hypothetical protein N6H14_29560 [Paenibacillus sp. CC-CFT747]|nr:hypothetical protein N6H14_29560 [Paenibacillus sp. CC-CFT747]